MAEQAYAYVTLIPVAKGFQREVAKQLDGVGGVGGKAGQVTGKNFSDGFGNQLKRMGVLAAGALATAGVGRLLGDSIKQASDLGESLNAVNVVFEESAAGIAKIGESASKNLGLSQTEFNAAAVQFSSFAEKIAGDGGDVVSTINELTTRGADFASVMNLEVSEALQVFQSGLAGETEPLKRFGIDLSAASVEAYALEAGIISAGESMTETQKVQARYGALLEQTAKTSGDFANTSDSLANQQRVLNAEFANVQASIGVALIPALEKLQGIVIDKVLPAFEDFGNWLESPSGIAAVEGLTNVITGLVEFTIDLIGAIGTALPILTALGTAFIVMQGKVILAHTAIKLATISQLALNAAMAANPIGLLITALALAAIGVGAFINATKEATPTQEELNDEIARTSEELEFYKEQQANSANTSKLYEGTIADLEAKLRDLRAAQQDSYNWTEAQTTASYEARDAALAQRLGTQEVTNAVEKYTDSVRLNSGELISNAVLQEAQSNYLQAYNYSLGTTTKTLQDWIDEIKARNFAELQGISAAEFYSTATDEVGNSASAAVQPVETLTDVIERQNEALENAKTNYADAVSTAQKEFKQAQQQISDDYNETIERATLRRDNAITDALSSYTDRVDEINERFAQRQADIVQRSMDRLRNVYSSVTAVDVADVFGGDAGGDVGSLIESLTGRLEASQGLVENSGLLAGAGFSQTFIEQVVGAGTAVGNEMAQAILNATPQQQARLQELFAMIEDQANTGMDALAETLYEKNGLATDQLNQLYNNVLIEQTEALAEQEQNYNETMASIMESFNKAVVEAKQTRDEALLDAELTLEAALVAANQAFLDSLEDIDKEFKAKISEMKSEVDDLETDIGDLNEQISNLRTRASSALAEAQAAIAAGNAGLGSGGNPEAFANGGFVTGPVNALVGEAGPEVIMPLDRFEKAMGIGNGGGKTLVYNAAPNLSVDSEQELFTAMRRAKVVANW